MAPSTFAILTLASLAMAQTTIDVPFLGYDSMTIVASVVGADSAATTLKLACPADAEDCGLFPYHTLTYGPSTYKMDMSVDGDGFTMTQDCSLAASSAVCTESASGSEANFPGSSVETYEGTQSPVTLPVSVTAGAEKLTASAAPAASASTTPASTGSAPTAKGNTTLSTSTRSPTGSASGPESTGAASTLERSLAFAIPGIFIGLFI